MQTPDQYQPEHFDELMATQSKLCDINKAWLSGDVHVDHADLEDARRDYTRKLRLNVWEVTEDCAGRPDETFDRVSEFLSRRMTEIVGSVTELFIVGVADCDAGEIRPIDCRAEYAKLIGGMNREQHDETEAVTSIINDAVDIAVPLAIGKAYARVRQLRSDTSPSKPAFSRVA